MKWVYGKTSLAFCYFRKQFAYFKLRVSKKTHFFEVQARRIFPKKVFFGIVHSGMCENILKNLLIPLKKSKALKNIEKLISCGF